jgi:hypothetical protein
MSLSDIGSSSQVGDSEAPAPVPLGSEDVTADKSAPPSPVMSADLGEAAEVIPSPAADMGGSGDLAGIVDALPEPAEIAFQAMDAGQDDLPVPIENEAGDVMQASRAGESAAPRPRDDLGEDIGQGTVISKSGAPTPMSMEDLGQLEQ